MPRSAHPHPIQVALLASECPCAGARRCRPVPVVFASDDCDLASVPANRLTVWIDRTRGLTAQKSTHPVDIGTITRNHAP